MSILTGPAIRAARRAPGRQAHPAARGTPGRLPPVRRRGGPAPLGARPLLRREVRLLPHARAEEAGGVKLTDRQHCGYSATPREWVARKDRPRTTPSTPDVPPVAPGAQVRPHAGPVPVQDQPRLLSCPRLVPVPGLAPAARQLVVHASRVAPAARG